LQHFGSRGLSLQRLGQFTRALLLGLEQAHVFDRDHRLVGEGLNQFDLPVRERPNFSARQDDYADRRTFTQQRHRQHGAESANSCTHVRGLSICHPISWIGENVCNLGRTAFE
jgi:hypothetical protein